MPSDLTPAEREERQVERLIGRKPAPSRKHTERRGPKYENRRRRIEVDDPDVKTNRSENDKDMSLNHKVVGTSIATSNKIGHDRMAKRLATYHGVIQQGHPSGPHRGYRSIDKRYFGNDHFDAILKYAKALLEEDWLKYNWDGGSEDANYRAALDLSIHLADDNLYQSKIDTETYNLILTRLMKLNQDSFSETVYSANKGKRSASVMNKAHVRNIIRIASSLQESQPKAAFEILKNLRSLVSSEASEAPAISAQVAQDSDERPPMMSDKMTGQQQQQGQQEQDACDMPGMPARPAQQQQQGQQEQLGQQEQQAGPEVIKKMIDDEMKKHRDQLKKKTDSGEGIGEEDLNQFSDGLNKALDEAFKKMQASNAIVPIKTIIRAASTSEAAFKTLLPILIAAKKKGKKTSQQEQQAKKGKKSKGKGKGKKDKKNPFGGKKAPPFAKKGEKVKKASVTITATDIQW